MFSVKKITTASVCLALCYVLPIAFHAVGLGSTFLPMHIPVLLCGLLCPWPYGLFCGIAGPILSSLLSSMPPAVRLIYMVPELAVYGLVTALLFRRIRTGNTVLDVYASLIPAMLLGRVIGGIVQAIFFLSTAQEFTLALWAGAYLIEGLPGIAVQLVLLPLLVLALTRAGLIPQRYAPKAVAAK